MSKPDSSIVVGVNLLKEGKAQRAGLGREYRGSFRGAFLKLGLIKGIERPAICAILDITGVEPLL